MANSERLPTVLYRTPAAASTPLSAGSNYTPSGLRSPSSPIIFSPLSNTSNYRNSSSRTPGLGVVPDSAMTKVKSPHTVSSSYGGVNERPEERSVAPRQLYGSGNTAPPPVMSLREGSSGLRPSGGLAAADTLGGEGRGGSKFQGRASGNDGGTPRRNPMLANEYAFGSGQTDQDSATDSSSFRSRWVTVYGFQQSDRDLILRELQECGDIISCRNGGTEKANFMHIQFQTKGEAQKALGKNGKQISKNLMIGITPISQQHCSSLQQQTQGGANGSFGGQMGAGSGGSWTPGAASSPFHGGPAGGNQHASKFAGGFDSMPQPVNTFWTKVNEYIFGI
ncbi:nuclear pore complex protein NUP35 [Chloropicon primus]|uniref:Nuclear pore complex protein NUP35 n=1 Tax=Chloropicon primus TaxID=1764295 RepID=A0A5B8MZ16_9CHLO|nr:nuclear pore complex protein NUP35 [Chloropicon primus]UPR04798.1 nuclear pore complex protein NUP35 [Chloropicon primus]|mmetsp:Transcript_6397/g.18960  ORF Transcript_6397/g.18960 Transcript_6397/m.18960 type:complete len:337 (+) Transcript_6397:63-1073(+)|eukprot:QDZ25601.1 nuclear pore complex protein NUP35 [Chloropicon primus]